MKEFKPIEYLLEVFERSEVRVSLAGGRVVVLRRAGLGRHYHLQALGQKISTAELDLRVDLLCTWLEAAGLCDLATLTLADLPMIVRAVGELNAPRGQFAWNLLREEKTEGKPTDYPGRPLARIVDLLARHYGWSLRDILELPPEVALAHMQECMLSDRRRKEWQRYLSEIFWEYDEGSKMRHYRPLPPLSWEEAPRSYEPVPQALKDKYYPKGVIIDLTKRRSS